jgi:hypothetical protein
MWSRRFPRSGNPRLPGLTGDLSSSSALRSGSHVSGCVCVQGRDPGPKRPDHNPQCTRVPPEFGIEELAAAQVNEGETEGDTTN